MYDDTIIESVRDRLTGFLSDVELQEEQKPVNNNDGTEGLKCTRVEFTGKLP
jgi:hypothetical protein